MLHDTCVSMLERAYPDEPGVARAASAADRAAYLLPDGSSADQRAIDVLMANCFGGPFGTPTFGRSPSGRSQVGKGTVTTRAR